MIARLIPNPKIRFWLSQLLPPALLLLLPLNELFNQDGNNGPGANFLWLGIAGLLFIPASFLLLIRLFRWRSQPLRWIRPLLTLTLLALLFALLQTSWERARQDALAIAGNIDLQCKQQGRCPQQLSGERPGIRPHVGSYLRYPLLYKASHTEFRLMLVISLDMSEVFMGGSTVALLHGRGEGHALPEWPRTPAASTPHSAP
ncbi:hypothetical protein [Chitinilyticum piscinae]|uniref:Uncharacterized protein n=1 Tax=Chitinilyticum piscinae TaxID=2866724 RepID=A0A8J7K108_9NEIS|nr:hypothetical protein [Chitinilyticum piscinae]MBE9608516.1 hypothetical protein [Chitinilyticum piscinae]